MKNITRLGCRAHSKVLAACYPRWTRFLVFTLPLLAVAVEAGPLTEAKVTKIVNEVKIVDPAKGGRPAALADVIKDEIGLETGLKSRSELLFQDNTLTRLGPETYFSFHSGTREMSLQQGTMLLQVPKGLGGAKIHSASVTASITGTTIMMEYVPNKNIKVLVLEGSLRLSNKGLLGDSVVLHPGQMVIMPPKARTIPEPVTVDLKKVVNTSSLVNMCRGKNGRAVDKPLPSIALIEKEVDRQQRGKDRHHLVDTNLVILGNGTNVLLGSDALMQGLDTRTDLGKLIAVTTAAQPSDNPVPPPVPVSTPAPPPGSTPPPPPPVSTPPPPVCTPPPPVCTPPPPAETPKPPHH
jgi:FecR protein